MSVDVVTVRIVHHVSHDFADTGERESWSVLALIGVGGDYRWICWTTHGPYSPRPQPFVARWYRAVITRSYLEDPTFYSTTPPWVDRLREDGIIRPIASEIRERDRKRRYHAASRVPA
jgi:hypothetical protein